MDSDINANSEFVYVSASTTTFITNNGGIETQTLKIETTKENESNLSSDTDQEKKLLFVAQQDKTADADEKLMNGNVVSTKTKPEYSDIIDDNISDSWYSHILNYFSKFLDFCKTGYFSLYSNFTGYDPEQEEDFSTASFLHHPLCTTLGRRHSDGCLCMEDVNRLAIKQRINQYTK